jgi:hypothetical protein
MINKKQTALQFFLYGLIDLEFGKDFYTFKEIELHNLYFKAKEIEKQQIIEAWICDDNDLQRIAAEKYYKETYDN